MSARRRFWKDVRVEQAGALWSPRLDGRPIRLPGGAALEVPSKPLAEAIAAEWGQIGEESTFSPDDLPLTRMAGTMIERIAPDPGAAREALLRFGLDDALCYRPAGYEGSAVESVFRWLGHYGIHPLVTDGLMPVEQSEAFRNALAALLAQQDDATLTALGVLVQASGSLLLALCLTGGGLSIPDGSAIACADEERQLRVWGQDSELQASIRQRSAEIVIAMEYLALCRGGGMI